MSMFRNIPEDGTIEIWINTIDTSGAPVAPSSAFAASDFAIHKDGSATEKTTTNGLTVTSPFDAETGLHLLVIDTSNDTGDAGFWATGSRYAVRFNTAKTVDSVSIDGRLVPQGQFGIESEYMRGTDSAAVAGDQMTLEDDAITSDKIQSDAIDAGHLAASAVTEIAAGILDRVLSGNHDTAGTPGAFLQQLDGSISGIGTAFLATSLNKGTAGTIERAFWQILKTQAVADGEVAGTPAAGAFDTNLTVADGVYDHQLLLFTSGALAGEARPIATYVNASGRITLQEDLTATPSASDEFIIVPQHIHPVSEIQSGLATATELAKAVDRTGYTLTVLAGAVSDAQTAAAEYTLTLDGNVHTVTYAGLTSAGVRTAPTLSKA